MTRLLIDKYIGFDVDYKGPLHVVQKGLDLQYQAPPREQTECVNGCEAYVSALIIDS